MYSILVGKHTHARTHARTHTHTLYNNPVMGYYVESSVVHGLLVHYNASCGVIPVCCWSFTFIIACAGWPHRLLGHHADVRPDKARKIGLVNFVLDPLGEHF